jgi:hypothetical protein
MSLYSDTFITLSAGRHVTLLGHIILFPRQLVFAHIPQTLSGEAANINLIVFAKATSVFKHLAETLSTIHHQYVVVPADKATMLLSAKIITLIAKR